VKRVANVNEACIGQEPEAIVLQAGEFHAISFTHK
jgi:hypothetical protein